jgi:hypothetical protein
MPSLSELSDKEIDKVTHLNAMNLFSYDPFSQIPREQATVDGLRARAEGWDVSVRATRHLRPVGAPSAGKPLGVSGLLASTGGSGS